MNGQKRTKGEIQELSRRTRAGRGTRGSQFDGWRGNDWAEGGYLCLAVSLTWHGEEMENSSRRKRARSGGRRGGTTPVSFFLFVL